MNWIKVTREESESRIPDYVRFRYPNGYMTEDSLKYFKSDELKESFKDQFWYNSDKPSIKWWYSLDYDFMNRLSFKYFNKYEPITLKEIDEIWMSEKQK